MGIELGEKGLMLGKKGFVFNSKDMQLLLKTQFTSATDRQTEGLNWFIAGTFALYFCWSLKTSFYCASLAYRRPIAVI
jgi:hypothetical protein